MRPSILFFAEGHPKGQPRPRAFSRGGHASVYNPDTADAWKASVSKAWKETVPKEDKHPFTGPVFVAMEFVMKRPKSHFGSGKRSGDLKLTAPRVHVYKPDIDNLAKPVLDVLTNVGAWKDDAQVTTIKVTRRWAEHMSGCTVRISEDLQ